HDFGLVCGNIQFLNGLTVEFDVNQAPALTRGPADSCHERLECQDCRLRRAPMARGTAAVGEPGEGVANRAVVSPSLDERERGERGRFDVRALAGPVERRRLAGLQFPPRLAAIR